jgi:ATP-dependent DNA ligase
MLSRPGPLPSGSGWSLEVKWDGFRAIVSTEDELRVRSRRGWNMTPVLPDPERPRPRLMERSLGPYVRDTARATSQERDFLREKERDVSSNFEG